MSTYKVKCCGCTLEEHQFVLSLDGLVCSFFNGINLPQAASCFSGADFVWFTPRERYSGFTASLTMKNAEFIVRNDAIGLACA